jgi:proline-specific peptidase
MVLSTESTVSFAVNGETFVTSYKLFGNLTESSLPPLIAVHGGPGLVGCYLSPLADLAEKNELQPVIIYDQLGNGKSSHVEDKPTEFFTVRLYIDELENLISKLGIKGYHLLGHSWGGALCSELEVQKHPSGLKSIILTNSLAEMRLADQSMGERIATLDNLEEVLEGFTKGFEDPKAFRKSVEALHGRYVMKYIQEQPLPDDLATFDWVWGNEEKGIKGDKTVTVKM